LSLALAACSSPCAGRTDPSTAAKASVPDALATTAPILRVPRIHEAIALEGELEEAAWMTAARTGSFIGEDGQPARPYSDAKFLVDDTHLYLGLYAADEDIQTSSVAHDAVLGGDVFSIRLQPVGGRAYLIDVSAAGVVSDGVETSTGGIDRRWESGTRLGIDRDGTLNQPDDDDEEWVVEMAIPLHALGVSAGGSAPVRLAARLWRWDRPRGSDRRLGTFEGTLELERESPHAGSP
jgi:hypothetical protein